MTARADRPRFSRPPRNEAKVQRRLRLARTAASPDNVRVFRRPTLVIRIALACAALLLVDAAVRAQTPPASWLDRPLANWNRANEQVPGAPVVQAFLVLPLVFGNQRAGLTRRALGGPLVTSLGEISYGLFLVHIPVIVAGYALLGRLPFTGNLLLVLITTWLISVGIATAVYAAVERPARRWRGLVPDHPRRTASASTEATTAEAATSART